MSNIVKFLSASMLFMSGAIWANAHAASTPAYISFQNVDRKDILFVEVQTQHHNYGRRYLLPWGRTVYTLDVEPIAGKYKVLVFNEKGYRLKQWRKRLYPGELIYLAYAINYPKIC